MKQRSEQTQIAAASVQPETITARSTDWPDIQLLLRSRPPGMVSLPHGQREHMIFCKSGRQDKSKRVRSVVRTEGRTREWKELPNQSVTFIPAERPFDWEWTYHSQAVHLLMSPDALGRVAAQISGRPVPSEDLLPQLCIHDAFVAALLERLGRELTGEGYGTLLAAEATTNLLAVHLLHAYSGRPLPAPRRAGRTELPPAGPRSGPDGGSVGGEHPSARNGGGGRPFRIPFRPVVQAVVRRSAA